MDDRALGYLTAVSAVAVWTPRPLVAMLDALGGAWELVTYAKHAATQAPPPCELLGAQALARIAAIDDQAAAEALEAARAHEAGIFTRDDAAYPQRLRDLCDPPPVLYYRGRPEALCAKVVAIVGSRAATPYGRTIAATIAADFASFDVTVVSGLARGIDAAAHRGAVRGETKTVAVLGSGLGALYPPYHRQLADEIIAAGGAIVSEFPPTAPARPFQFPMRNRLVAALAEATLVVEAGPASGALITARLAGDLGRPVFAIPGDIGRRSSVGTNELIKDGVALATGAADIASVLGWERVAQKTVAKVGDDQLLVAIAPGGSSIDELCAASGLEPGSIAAQLTVLEMQGLVEAHSGGLYTRLE